MIPDGLFLAALLDNVPDAVYFKDRESRFIGVSRSTAAKHGLEVKDMLGKTDFDLFVEPFARKAYDDEQRIMRTGEPLIAQLEKEVWPDGRITWSLNHKMALREADGTVVGTWGMGRDVTAAKAMELELERAHLDLMHASHLAGMAEVATSVLHNVGNVLSSVNVSVSMLESAARRLRVETLGRLAELVRGQGAAGKEALVPDLIAALTSETQEIRDAMLEEIASLHRNLDHIQEIVATQQAYATTLGVTEPIDVAAVMDDALRMNHGALTRHELRVEKHYAPTGRVLTQRAKVLQILVNLIQNAKYACEERGAPGGVVTLRVEPLPPAGARLVVEDNGIGIPPENLPRIFTHGFTTRKNGHGFGLHSAANAAKEMGGSLTVRSDGPGKGAVFTLDLP